MLPTNPRGQNCPPYKKTPALQAALVLPHSLACRPIPERYPARRKNSESQSATVRTATDGLPLKITARQRTKSNLSQFETLQPPLSNPTKGEGRQDSSRNRSAIGPQARRQANTDTACSLALDSVASASVARSQAAGSAVARQGAGDKPQLCWQRKHRPTNCAGRLCINAAIPYFTSSLAISGAKSGSSREIATSSP